MTDVPELDTKGLNCPLPVLKAKKALKALKPGETIRILSTDPHSQRDFPAYCKNAGHELVEHGESDGVYRYVIRKGEPRLKEAS